MRRRRRAALRPHWRVRAIPAYLETARANLLRGKQEGNLPDRRLVQHIVRHRRHERARLNHDTNPRRDDDLHRRHERAEMDLRHGRRELRLREIEARLGHDAPDVELPRRAPDSATLRLRHDGHDTLALRRECFGQLHGATLCSGPPKHIVEGR